MKDLKPENKRLKIFIEEKRTNINAFAVRTGISAPTIRHITSGRNSFGMETLRKIKDAFPELDLEWLIMGKREESEDIETNVTINANSYEPKSDYKKADLYALREENRLLSQKLEQQQEREHLLKENIESLKQTIDTQKKLIEALK